MRTMFLFSTFYTAVDKVFNVNGHFGAKETIASAKQCSFNSHKARKMGAMDTVQNKHN